MELQPMTLIMHALEFGAVGIATGVLNQNGMELWDGFKTAIQRKFTGKAEAQMVLDRYEKRPNVWVQPLKEELIAVRADQDNKIMALARKLKELEDALQERSGERNVINVKGGTIQGLIQENKGTNNMYFGPPPTKE